MLGPGDRLPKLAKVVKRAAAGKCTASEGFDIFTALYGFKSRTSRKCTALNGHKAVGQGDLGHKIRGGKSAFAQHADVTEIYGAKILPAYRAKLKHIVGNCNVFESVAACKCIEIWIALRDIDGFEFWEIGKRGVGNGTGLRQLCRNEIIKFFHLNVINTFRNIKLGQVVAAVYYERLEPVGKIELFKTVAVVF